MKKAGDLNLQISFWGKYATDTGYIYIKQTSKEGYVTQHLLDTINTTSYTQYSQNINVQNWANEIYILTIRLLPNAGGTLYFKYLVIEAQGA
jgi:hypothetical protein